MNARQEELYEFIKANHPGYGKCLVCKGTFMTDNGEEATKYFCVEKHKIQDGDNYTINDRLWYDYAFYWEKCGGNFEIIFKSK